MRFSENTKVTKLYQGLGNAVDCDVVNMKNYNHGAFLVCHTGSTDVDLVLSLYEATTAGKSTTQAITKVVPIYIDPDAGASSDVVAATTAAYSYTIDPATQDGVMLIFEIDPSILSTNYSFIYLADSGGSSGNYVSIFFLGEPRYRGATLPSAIS